MSEKFKIIIGDWSGDGHNMTDTFIVETDKTFKDVKNAHFNMKEIAGISVEDFCSEYEDCIIPGTIVKKLKQLGFEHEEIEFSDDILTEDEEQEEVYASSDLMADIWVFLMNKADETLNAKIIKDSCPTLNYSRSENGGYVGSVGYGVFSC